MWRQELMVVTERGYELCLTILQVHFKQADAFILYDFSYFIQWTLLQDQDV